MVATRFRDEGVDVLIDHKAKQVRVEDGEKVAGRRARGRARCASPFDQLLVRRRARAPTPRATASRSSASRSPRDARSRSTSSCGPIYPNIFACGDVAGPYQFTHTASHQAWYAAVNALFGRFRKFRADYSRDPVGHVHRARGRARRA